MVLRLPLLLHHHHPSKVSRLIGVLRPLPNFWQETNLLTHPLNLAPTTLDLLTTTLRRIPSGRDQNAPLPPAHPRAASSTTLYTPDPPLREDPFHTHRLHYFTGNPYKGNCQEPFQPLSELFDVVAPILNRTQPTQNPIAPDTLRRQLARYVHNHADELHPVELRRISPWTLTNYLLDRSFPPTSIHINAYNMLFGQVAPLYVWRPIHAPLSNEEVSTPERLSPDTPHAGNTWTCNDITPPPLLPSPSSRVNPIHIIITSPHQPTMLANPAGALVREHGTHFRILNEHPANRTTYNDILSNISHTLRPPPEPD